VKGFVAALLAAVVTLSGCHDAGRKQYGSGNAGAWDDYAPYTADLADSSLLRNDRSLRASPVYHLKISVSDDLRSLDGDLEVRYTNDAPNSLGTIDFLLYPNLITGSMRVDGVTADGESCGTELLNRDTLMRVELPEPLAAGARAVIRLSFHADIPGGDLVGFGGFGYSNGVLSMGYDYPVIPAGGRWEDGTPPAWGDLTANPTAFYLCDVSFPTGLVLAAPGAELRRVRNGVRTNVLFAHGPARDLFFALGKSFEERSLSSNGIRIRSFANVEVAPQAELLMQEAARAVADFSRRFGPYPYKSLTFVQARLDAFGLEFPGMIVLAPWLYGDPEKRADGLRLGTLLEATAVHETGHQWFYALVGNNQLEEPWIDESLAQLATWYYYLDTQGIGAADAIERSFKARWQRVDNAEIPLGLPVRNYTPKQYSSIIYGRGPLFFLTLRNDIGADAFDRFLREIVRRFRWQVVTGADLRLAAAKAAGRSLDALWNSWIYPQ